MRWGLAKALDPSHTLPSRYHAMPCHDSDRLGPRHPAAKGIGKSGLHRDDMCHWLCHCPFSREWSRKNTGIAHSQWHTQNCQCHPAVSGTPCALRKSRPDTSLRDSAGFNSERRLTMRWGLGKALDPSHTFPYRYNLSQAFQLSLFSLIVATSRRLGQRQFKLTFRHINPVAHLVKQFCVALNRRKRHTTTSH